MYVRSRIVLLSLLIFLVTVGLKLREFVALFYAHSGVLLTQEDIAAAHANDTQNTRRQLIPRIIHQIHHNWHNASDTSIPSDWDAQRQSCINLNQGWEYKLWTAQSSLELITKHYPWFLPTYESYRYPVQRVDAFRYILMYHYGGIYLDLDNGCLKPLTPLLYYPLFTTDGGRGALSNNILGSMPNHPFFGTLTASLVPYNYNYLFPYLTIAYASGQIYFTAIWEKFNAQMRAAVKDNAGSALQAWDSQMVRISMDMAPGAPPWVFFDQGRGGSWLNWDNAFFGWVGDHLLLLGLGAVIALGGLWFLFRRRMSLRKQMQYKKVDGLE